MKRAFAAFAILAVIFLLWGTAHPQGGTGIGESYVTMKQQATTPSSPGATYNRLYFKTDGKLYYVNSAGTEAEAGAAASDTAYNATSWDNVTTIPPSKNVVRDKFETLLIGTHIQAYDADLTTYAGITPSANVQTLLGSADYAAFRTSLETWGLSGSVTDEQLICGETTGGTNLLKSCGAKTTDNSTTGNVIVKTGAATVGNLSTEAIATTGTIQGGIKISSDADGMDATATAAAGMYGTLFLATGAGTWILPTAVSGMNLCLMDTGTAHDLILDIQAADTLMFNGTVDTAGDGITNASGSSTGDKICVVAYGAGTWIVTSSSGTWVAQ